MVNSNADEYAAARQNHWFTANNQTSADGNLTGQCVTLDKWFFQDMCNGFPSPFAARGNAKDVGHTLVAQGLAVEVAWNDRRQGDIICYEYGTYGHTAVQLSGGRVFESNVNWSGVASRVVDGETVYASRIGSENEAWRLTRNPHVYRLNSYSEGGNMSASDTPVDANVVQLAWNGIMLGDAPADAVSSRVAAKQPVAAMLSELIGSPQHNAVISDQQLGHKARELLGGDTTPANMEAKMIAKYGSTGGGSCTPEERAYLDAMYKVVNKKG